jgi:hypothetical protein
MDWIRLTLLNREIDLQVPYTFLDFLGQVSGYWLVKKEFAPLVGARDIVRSMLWETGVRIDSPTQLSGKASFITTTITRKQNKCGLLRSLRHYNGRPERAILPTWRSSVKPVQAERYAHIYRGRRGHGACAHSRNGQVSRRAICFDYGFRSPPPMNNGCILQ